MLLAFLRIGSLMESLLFTNKSMTQHFVAASVLAAQAGCAARGAWSCEKRSVLFQSFLECSNGGELLKLGDWNGHEIVDAPDELRWKGSRILGEQEVGHYSVTQDLRANKAAGINALLQGGPDGKVWLAQCKREK